MLRHALFMIMLLTSCSSVSNKQICLPSKEGNTPCRPNRAGILKLNPQLDSEKPLGSVESGGWVLVDGLAVGSADESWLRGFSIETKEIKWWLKIDSSVSAPLEVFGTDVIVGLRDGSIMKIEGKTGRLIWKKNLGRFISRRAAKVGKKLYVVTVDQKLFSLDYSTGKTNWVYSSALPSGIVLDRASKPVSMGGIIFLGTSDGKIEGISTSSGKKIWTFNPGPAKSRFTDIVGEMAVLDGHLLVSRYDGYVFSLNVATGRRRAAWKKELPVITYSYYRGGIYYVGCLNGDFYAFDAANGKKLWKVSVGEPVASITPGEKIVYVGGTDGKITAISGKSGKVLWYDDVEGGVSPSPLLVGDVLYFSTGLKVLYGYKIL